MKQFKLKTAVFGALNILCAQAFALGLEPFPATGFPTTGTVTTAYRLCNTTGNFGSSIPSLPTTTSNNACAVFPINQATAPVAGYTIVTSAVRGATISNTYTNNTSIGVGNVTEYVWRDSATSSQCIYGAQFFPSPVDYQPTVAGNQFFEVNDIALGGFGASGTVNAGYYLQAAAGGPVFRIGRTFTAVQHRPASYSFPANAAPGTGYQAIPGLGSTVSINGETTGTTTTTAATQQADVNSNWVNFTVHSLYDVVVIPAPLLYVQAGCSSAAPVATANAIRLRQTGQEGQPFIEVSVIGFLPPGGSATPAPVVPY